MSHYQFLHSQLEYVFENANLLKEAFGTAGAANSRNDVDEPTSCNKCLSLIGEVILHLNHLEEWFLGGDSTG